MELKFKNGKFRIMQIADVQDTQNTSQATIRFIREALKIAKPDLVVFTGDQVKGYGFYLMGGDNRKKVTECINKFLVPLDETGIPFTFVFGNHDDQAFSISKKEQFDIYKSHENCVAYNADDRIDGFCNHNLEINQWISILACMLISNIVIDYHAYFLYYQTKKTSLSGIKIRETDLKKKTAIMFRQ